jgi:two-component system response regulator QseB
MSDTLRGRPSLLLIEDDPQLGPIICDVLDEVYDVTLVADGTEGLKTAQQGDYDALVVDRRLPGLDGVTLVRRLRESGVGNPVLLLTALATVGDRVEGLDAGADDYLVKPFEFEELLARLRAIRRVHPVGGQPLALGDWEFYPAHHAIHSPYTGRVVLTPKESALLELLANEPARTFSREKILTTVFDTGERPGTVDTYVHYIRRKTEHDLIETVRGRGYRIGQLE